MFEHTLSEEKIFLISKFTFAFTARHRQSVITGPPWESPQGSGHEDTDTLNCLIGDSSPPVCHEFPINIQHMILLGGLKEEVMVQGWGQPCPSQQRGI